MQNYSQTYAAAITTFAPIVVLLLGRFGLEIAQEEFIQLASAAISFIGLVWQLVHRYQQGGITRLGRKV